MKKIYVILLLFAGIISSFAQPSIKGYEYWFNNDFANRTTTTVASAQQLLINQTIPTPGLLKGINVINFRSFDDLGKYSSVVSSFFYKTSLSKININPDIVAYEYWLDNDYTKAVKVNTPVQEQININELISTSTLIAGIHNFNIRFKDNTDKWSSVVSHFIYKTPEPDTNGQNKIVAYRYWLDNTVSYMIKVNLSTPVVLLNLDEIIDLKLFSVGKHTLHFQFKDETGKWSSVTSDNIEKINLSLVDNTFKNNILAYPNPTNGKVFVAFGETLNDIKVSIHNINGKLIQQSVYKYRQSLVLSISEPAGVYLVTISSENKMATLRLIKY